MEAEDQGQKGVVEGVVGVGVAPFVDEAEVLAAEVVHNTHTEEEERTWFQDNHT